MYIESAAMQTTLFSLRPFVLLALAVTGVALAQTPSPKKQAANPALAALHAIDDCEANLEADFSHIGKDDFEEVAKNTTYKTKLQRAHDAVDKVTDADLQRDLNLLLSEVEYGLTNASMALIIDKNDQSLARVEATFHSDRELVATEIATGKRGLVRDAVLKRNTHKG
jgi:hypothetical protein